MNEKVATQYESRVGCQVLWDTNEVIWYSERDNWGHLYLYDLGTGTLKNRITSGDGPVMQIIRLDEKTRTLWFQAQGREKGEDPYFRHYYRIGLDGTGYAAAHAGRRRSHDPAVAFGPLSSSTRTRSPTCRPAVALRDGDGKFVMMLEKADISRLRATGWKPPMPITMKAHDGKTDIYGLLFRPTQLRSGEEVPNRQQRVSRAADGQHRQPRLHAPRAAIARLWRSSGSSSSRSTAWERRAGRRRSRTRTTARWAATTRSRIRSRA